MEHPRSAGLGRVKALCLRSLVEDFETVAVVDKYCRGRSHEGGVDVNGHLCKTRYVRQQVQARRVLEKEEVSASVQDQGRLLDSYIPTCRLYCVDRSRVELGNEEF